MINVAIIDDEALMRSGLRMILEGAGDISVPVATSGGDAVEQIRDAEVGVVLLDLQMADRSGMDVLGELRLWESPPTVAILTTFNTEANASAALRAGASGFIVKDTDPLLLPALVRTLAGGGVVLSPEVSRNLFRACAPLSGDVRRKMESLSSREQDVLRQLSAGASNGDIARSLFLSTTTVKDHVSTILRKLDVSTRLQAALIAERGGLGS